MCINILVLIKQWRNTMNKIMIIGLSILSLSQFASANISSSIGMESEYFFRGESQGEGTAMQMSLHGEKSGWFGGVWASQIDHEVSSWEHNFYGGYSFNLSEDTSFYGGVIDYDYDSHWLKIGPDAENDRIDSKEYFIGSSYKSVSLEHYVDSDNSDLTYTQFGYDLPLGLAMIDLMFTWGRFNDGDDVFGLKGTKALGDWDISIMAMKRNNMDSHSSVGLHYNF